MGFINQLITWGHHPVETRRAGMEWGQERLLLPNGGRGMSCGSCKHDSSAWDVSWVPEMGVPPNHPFIDGFSIRNGFF